MQEVGIEKGCSTGRNDLRLMKKQCSHEYYFREIAMFIDLRNFVKKKCHFFREANVMIFDSSRNFVKKNVHGNTSGR